MAGQDQSARLQGLLSGIAGNVGELGKGGEWTSNAIRTVARPDFMAGSDKVLGKYGRPEFDMENVDNLNAMANWADRNDRQEEATRYMALSSKLAETQGKKSWSNTLGVGTNNLRTLQGQINATRSAIAGGTADQSALDPLIERRDALIKGLNTKGEADRYGSATAGSDALTKIVGEITAAEVARQELAQVALENAETEGKIRDRIATGNVQDRETFRWLTDDQYAAYVRGHSAAEGTANKIKVNENFGGVNTQNEGYQKTAAEAGASAGLSAISRAFINKGEGQGLSMNLRDAWGDTFLGKLLGAKPDRRAKFFDTATHDFFETLVGEDSEGNPDVSIIEANNKAITAKLLQNPDYPSASMSEKREMEAEAFVNFYKQAYPKFEEAYAKDRVALEQEARGNEVERQDREADYVPGTDPNSGAGQALFNDWFNQARIDFPELTYDQARKLWDDKYYSGKYRSSESVGRGQRPNLEPQTGALLSATGGSRANPRPPEILALNPRTSVTGSRGDVQPSGIPNVAERQRARLSPPLGPLSPEERDTALRRARNGLPY